MSKKYRIQVLEVSEDGSASPFKLNDGTELSIPDRESFLIVATDDKGDSCDCTSVLHNMSINDIATALKGHKVLLKAARITALFDVLTRKMGLENDEASPYDDEEDDDATE